MLTKMAIRKFMQRERSDYRYYKDLKLAERDGLPRQKIYDLT